MAKDDANIDMMEDTIFALSSGAPPAALAVIRISGPRAASVINAMTGALPAPRRASLRTLYAPETAETAQETQNRHILDRALILWLPGPKTVTGEDLAELHLHGGRAVIAAVEKALGQISGLRRAEAGEFTRRGFANGILDLAEAEGLADLLGAETELQRQSAVVMAGGGFSRQVEKWRVELLQLSAALEAALDFSDEEDANSLPASFDNKYTVLADDLREWLKRPRAELLKQGFRVVLAGPPNAGKSTLFNALIDDEAAITSSHAGTTRDVIERSVSIQSLPFTFVDTAGLHEDAGEPIEAEGIERARIQMTRADLVLWLGESGKGPENSLQISAKCDLGVSLSSTQSKISPENDAAPLTPTSSPTPTTPPKSPLSTSSQTLPQSPQPLSPQQQPHPLQRPQPPNAPQASSSQSPFSPSQPITISAHSGEGLDVLRAHLCAIARHVFPKPGAIALNERQSQLLQTALNSLDQGAGEKDLLLIAENLRQVRLAFDALIGRSSTEDMLDMLFSGFCIGK